MILPCEIIISDPQVDPIFEDSHLEDIFQIHFQSQKVQILIFKLYFRKNMDYAEDCFAIFLNYQSENKRLDQYLCLLITCLVVNT